MVKIELKEIVSNHDNRRKALNAVERGKKKTNPQYPYYGANGIVDFIDEYIFDEELLCIAEDGGNWGYKQNCSYIVNGKYWVNNHVHVLKPKKNVEIKYLMYYLNCTDLTSYITGTTRGKLTRTALDKIQINLPELEIQREIVIILDKINNLMEKNKKRIIYLEELVKSRFIEMFGDPIRNEKGWEQKFLEKISSFESKNITKYLKCNDLIWLLNLEDIEQNTGKIIKKKMITKFEIPTSIIAFDENYVLYSKLRPYLNKVVLPLEEGIGTSELIPILPRNEVNRIYLFNVLTSESVLKFLKMKVSGAKMPRIIMSDFKKLKISLPEIKLQNEFAEFVEKTNKLKFEAEKSLKEMENLYESLMQKFFKQN